MSGYASKLVSMLSVLTLLALSQVVGADDLIVGQYFDNSAVEILNGTNEGVKFTSSNTSRFYGMAFDTSGYLYVAGANTNNIERFSPTGTDLGTFVTGQGTSTSWVAFDHEGDLYVNNDNSSETGTSVSKFSSNGSLLGVAANVPGAYSIAFDSSDDLYVSSYSQGKVYRFSPTGASLGSFALGFTPGGMAFDAAGNLYVADRTDSEIYRFSPTGTNPDVFASTGMNAPVGIAFDSAGNLFVANYGGPGGGGSTVREFSSTGSDLGNYVTGLSSPLGLAFRPDSVPEASTLITALLGLGLPGAGLLIRRRMRK